MTPSPAPSSSRPLRFALDSRAARAATLRFGVAAAALATLLSAGSAFALTQPDGTPIPQGPSLQNLFVSRGEAINASVDALTVPETFVPSCALSFEVLQRNAGYQNAFGWYNVTGAAPAIGDLHEFIHCSDPVGTIKPLPNIKSDPAYLGGEIGFYEGVITGCGPGSGPANYAYVFYSEKSYNPDGNAANPYIHLLIYNSTAVPNAFYFGWEDLISGGDNDFDDLTTFVTGITCAGGGGACQTGQLGICADGTEQCQNGVLACVPLSQPSTETCDGFDNDCNGLVDDGDICADGKICDNGNCVPKCGDGEFVCPADKQCDLDKGLCVDPDCVGKSCQEGTKCVDGICKDPCNGVVCPKDQACIAGVCLDPCGVIVCDDTQVCIAGACVDKCQCAGCPAGEQCQDAGACLFDACVGKTCPEGTYCAADGTCVDACQGANCPDGQICVTGQCVAGGEGGAGGGTGVGGFNFGGQGGTPAGTGGAGAAGAAGGAGGQGGQGGGTSGGAGGGCGCRVVDDPAAPAGGLFLALAAWLAGRARRGGERRRSAAEKAS